MPRLSLVALEDRLAPAVINFALTTSTSKYTISGTVNGSTITQQAAGSLTTTYSGTVQADVDFAANTIELLGPGSSMAANNSGTWAPAVGGGSAFSVGSAPGNYGGSVVVTLSTKVAARNLVTSVSAPPTAITGASFPSTPQTLALTSGNLDYNNFGLQGTSTLGGSGPNVAANGTFTDLGNGNYSLVLPGDTTINDNSSGFAVVLRLVGTLNATATLPVTDLNGAATGFDATFSHAAGGTPSLIAPAATITRTPSANLTGMTLTLGGNVDGTAESLAVDLSGTTLTTTGYDTATGKLTITGAGTLATYQSVLRTATYANANTAGTPGPRTVSIAAADAANTSLIRLAAGTVTGPASAKVSSVQVNNGGQQQSRVTGVTVTFNSIVALPGTPGTAFQLVRTGDGAVVSLSAAIDNTGPGTVATLSFTGGPLNNGSLQDGRYTLTVLASQVNAGNFDGDGNGTPGDNFTLTGNPATNKLFRLFGDSDGNGTVDSTDFAALGTFFGQSVTNNPFDYDINNTINADDLGFFGNRFGTSI